MRKCLIIGKVWPEPRSTAAGARTLELVRFFQKAGIRCIFACAAQPNEFCEDLTEWSLDTQIIQLNHSSFDEFVADLDPTIVMFDRYMTEEQFGWRVEKAAPDALRILDTSDLHCLREARRKSLQSGEPIELFNETALREIASIYRSDLTLMISDAEMRVLDQAFGISKPLVAHLPFSIEPSFIHAGPAFDERKHCAMIGSFMHPPNVDSVRWCIESIWPKVRADIPYAELHIYGSYSENFQMPKNSAHLGIYLKGRMGDVGEELSKYRLNLAPLRYGAGLKGKVIDGLRTGTPTVCSEVAFEGIGDLPQEFVGADLDTFVSICTQLYRDETAWSRANREGRKILDERFNAARNYQHFRTLVDEASQHLHQRRKQNFIGQMLRHHNHRSTEFMSRWIELKNTPKA